MSRVEIIGAATLHLGDAREIVPTLGKVDHIITDPPYSERTHTGHDSLGAKDRPDGSTRAALGYAALSPEDAAALAAMFDAASLGWVVWLTDHVLVPTIEQAMKQAKRTTFAPLPYHHAGRAVRLAGDGPSSWTDWIMVARTVALKHWGTLRGGYVAGPGWDDKERMGGKPTRLMRMLVCDYSRHGETVCDPFMGAGTTGVAAMLEGRSFVGVEIDTAAFDTACRRIEQAQRQSDMFIASAA